MRASIGLSDEVKHQWSVPLGKGFAGTIAATRKPIMLRHASKDPLPLSPYLRGSGIRALYGVPLIFNDELLGVAHMGSRTAFEFSDEDRALFYAFTGYWLFTLYRLVPPAQRTSLRRFVMRAWRDGLYDPRWSRGLGRKRRSTVCETSARVARCS